MSTIPSLFENYISDVAVTMVFGLGYYLFRGLKKKQTSWKDENHEIKKLKNKLEDALDRYQYAKTIEEYNNLIETDYKTEDPFLILNEMTKKGLPPNIETYNALLLKCFLNGRCDSAKLLYEEIIDIIGPVSPNNYTLNIFIKGLNINYNKCLISVNDGDQIEAGRKRLQDEFDYELKIAVKKFNERGVQMDVIATNTVIESLADQGRLDEAWNTYLSMKSMKPDEYTYSAMLKAIKHCQPRISLEWLTRAFHIMDEAKFGFQFDDEVIVFMLDACLKHNKLEKMEELFNEFREKSSIPEAVYSIMIKSYGLVFKLDKCFELVTELRKKNIKPSDVTYTALLKAIVRCKKIEFIDKLVEEMKKESIEITQEIYFIILNGYKNSRNYEKALKLYDSIVNKFDTIDIGIINTVLTCCVCSNKFPKMEEIYSNQKTDNHFPQPDIITYSVMLKGFAKANKTSQIISLYDEVRSINGKLDEVVYNSLLERFAENNDEENLNKLYQDMKKNQLKIGLVTYSLLLKLNSNIDNTVKCIELYEDIVKAGIKLNAEMYTISLHQYLKSNMIDQPVNIFRKMIALKMDPERKLFDLMVKNCMEKGKDKEAFDFSLSALKVNYKFEDSVYNTLVENLMANEKCKTQEKFDFLNRLNKEVKYKGIKLEAGVIERSNKFINTNKVVKPSLYTSNSLYSGMVQVQQPVPIPQPNTSANAIVKDDDPEKKKKKKKKKKGKVEETSINKNETVKVSQDYASTGYVNQGYGKYQSDYNYYNTNDDDLFYGKAYAKVPEKSVYSSKKVSVAAVDFRRGDYYKK